MLVAGVMTSPALETEIVLAGSGLPSKRERYHLKPAAAVAAVSIVAKLVKSSVNTMA